MSNLNYFQLENDLKSTVRIDAPLTKGPAPRWERQGLNLSAATGSLANSSIAGMNTSRNQSVNMSVGLNASRTAKTPKEKQTKNQSAKKTPGPGANSAKKPSLTPGNEAGKKIVFADRFIPARSTSAYDTAGQSSSQTEENTAPNSQNDTVHKRLLDEELGEKRDHILSYSVKPNAAPMDHVNTLKVVYTQASLPASVSKNAGRFISPKPDRILDAPALMDDFYLHPLDWSRNNHVAVALSESVYVWNAGTSEIHHLTNLYQDHSEETTSTSVAWMESGTHLAVGTSDGEILLYDVAASRRVRRMRGHTSRVSTLAWNEYAISSGSGVGCLSHYDIRVADFNVSSIPTAHSGLELCGLAWSPDKRYLASGGNDNSVKIWVPGESAAGGKAIAGDAEPLTLFTYHQAAVKALAWCPWRPSVLASGGGTNDRFIRMWNASNGSIIKEVDTQSQISALAWSEEYYELVSTHGHASNQIVLWKYPNLEVVARLEGHEARVLDMAMSPDKTTIVTAGADETLRIWKCFQVDEERRKFKLKKEACAKGGRSAFQTLMR